MDKPPLQCGVSIQSGSQGPLLYSLHVSLHVCPTHYTLPPPDQSQRWTGGGGRVAVLYCFFYTSHSSLIESFYEVQKCPFPHKLAVGGPPAAELQSILQLGEGKEQVYQFRIQVYKSELATCQVLS